MLSMQPLRWCLIGGHRFLATSEMPYSVLACSWGCDISTPDSRCLSAFFLQCSYRSSGKSSLMYRCQACLSPVLGLVLMKASMSVFGIVHSSLKHELQM